MCGQEAVENLDNIQIFHLTFSVCKKKSLFLFFDALSAEVLSHFNLV